jgi:hypothetical protein
MAKKDKIKLPKTVGGVKVPKKLRKRANVIAEIAQSPLAREAASAALIAAASALLARKDKPAESAKPATDDKKAKLDVGGLVAQGIAAFVTGLVQEPRAPQPSQARTSDERPKPKLVP